MFQQFGRATVAGTAKWSGNRSRSAPDLARIDTPAPRRDCCAMPAALAGVPVRPPRLRQVLIFSPGGSQGGAVAAQALQNSARGRFSVLLRSRSLAPEAGGNLVRCGARTVDVARHAGAVGTPPGPLALDPAETLVIDPTAVGGLHHTIAQTPPGSDVVYLQNGLPSHADVKQARGIRPHDMISLVAAGRRPGEGVTVAPGGVMLVGENDPLTETLHTVLHGEAFFRLQNVPDIRAARYEKVALNCALNATATLFGKTLGELRELAARDVRCERLIAGLAGEVCALARKLGVPVGPDDRVMAAVHRTMRTFPHHRTSMQAAFAAGLETEIEVLNAGVAREAGQHGLPAPLNELVCRKLALYEAVRRADGASAESSADSPAGFYRRHQALVERTVGELLQAAGKLG